MSETKVVYLKLSAPRLDQIVTGLIKAIENGWVTHVKSHDFSPKKVLLQKEVPITSNWPEETVWNCRTEFPVEPSIDPVIQDVIDNSEVNILSEETETDIESSGNISLSLTLPKANEENVVTIHYPKTSDGFEMRPYTLEELKDIKWQDLTKLGASLGVSDGKRDERELGIVKASLEQWGVKVE